MNALSRLCLIALASLVAFGCSAQTPRPSFQTERTNLGLMSFGEISPESVEALQAELREGDRLIVKSPGGERRSAERLADLLAERDVEVRVNADCFSACALYLALGAPRAIVPEGALVLFHSDTVMWKRAVAYMPAMFSTADRTEIERADAALQRIIQRQGVSPEILSCIATAIRPNYAAMRRTPAAPAGTLSTHEVPFAIPSDYDYVWLSPNVLAHFGARGLEVQWSHNAGGRETYAEWTGKRIVWVDTVEQCQ